MSNWLTLFFFYQTKKTKSSLFSWFKLLRKFTISYIGYYYIKRYIVYLKLKFQIKIFPDIYLNKFTLQIQFKLIREVVFKVPVSKIVCA